MHPNTGRWLQIKKISPEELDVLHKIEREAHALERRQRKDDAAGNGKVNPSEIRTWREGSTWFFREMNLKYGPVFPARVSDLHKRMETEKFESQTKAIWIPLYRAYEKDKDALEIEWIHQADCEIRRAKFFIQSRPAKSKTKNAELDRVLNAKDGGGQ